MPSKTEDMVSYKQGKYWLNKVRKYHIPLSSVARDAVIQAVLEKEKELFITVITDEPKEQNIDSLINEMV